MEAKQLIKLRNSLRKGDQKAIAEMHGLSESMVGKVLRGVRYNDDVIRSAVEIAQKRKATSEKLTAKIERL